MDTKPNPSNTETAEQREQALSKLTPREREVVESILADYPTMTARECIEHCRAMGM